MSTKASRICKKDVIDRVYESLNGEVSKKDVKAVVDATFETISSTIAGGTEIAVDAFGIFRTTKSTGRVGRNLKTGESIQIQPSTSVRFKQSLQLKRLVNNR